MYKQLLYRVIYLSNTESYDRSNCPDLWVAARVTKPIQGGAVINGSLSMNNILIERKWVGFGVIKCIGYVLVVIRGIFPIILTEAIQCTFKLLK